MKYRSRKSIPILLLTVFGGLIFLSLSFLCLNKLNDQPSLLLKLFWSGLSILPIVFIILGFAFSPKYIAFSKIEKKIKIIFPFHTKEFDIDKIIGVSKVSLVPPSTISTKGFFGFLGLGGDGSYTFINDTNSMFCLQFKSSSYILSCDNKDELLNQLK